jgi:hypothetical protein
LTQVCFTFGSYLELADWELKEALQSAKEDREWEKEESQGNELKAGQIGVRINFNGGQPLLNLKGIEFQELCILTKSQDILSAPSNSFEIGFGGRFV